MNKYYSDERNIQILISLLKQYNIRKIVVSPGATNVSFVGSIQHDDFFELYSCMDERSAAYMACGLSDESNEIVALSCTGATSSRNYLPGITEAYYRQLPILAITSSQDFRRVGHLVAQVTDRTVHPKDTYIHDEQIAICRDAEDEWDATVRINRALLALTHHGGGPVHINLATSYSRNFNIQVLPKAKKINRYYFGDQLPSIEAQRVAIFVGVHSVFSARLTKAIDCFCEKYNAVVFCDHGSNYKGKYRVCSALIGGQDQYFSPIFENDLLIHIGRVTGDYSNPGKLAAKTKAVWRIDEDGELRDQFHKLENIFEMKEVNFFEYYAVKQSAIKENTFYPLCVQEYHRFQNLITEVPFSNIWVAQNLSNKLPKNSILHLGILNSLRAWNLFEIDKSIHSYVNTGGFGIDGVMSSFIGGSLSAPEKLHFLIIGDLSFFYDFNIIGNRHIKNNIRILLINNGKGTEFRNYNHLANNFGDEADLYMSAAGHNGKKSGKLIKNIAENLGFTYFAAENKQKFNLLVDEFVVPLTKVSKPMIFEIFTNSDDESQALYQMNNLFVPQSLKIKRIIKKIIPDAIIKKINEMR